MKSNFFFFTMIVAMLLSNTVSLTVNAQTITADTIKNTPYGEGFNDLLFQVGDSTVMKIASDSNVTINTNLGVPNGSILVDSIRARVIHVGDSSLVLAGTT